jgi:RimJ/RimL family protein N-acetyltransferase
MSEPSAATGVVLETERLVLRRFDWRDLDALAEIQRDAEVMRFLGGARSRAVIAYLLGSRWWARGYATEAAAAIRDHARSQLGFERLISLIDPDNVASHAVATRIMHHERDLLFEGRPTSLFALKNQCQAPILQARA